MKKIFFLILMAFILLPSSAQDGRRKKKPKQEHTTEIVTPIRPIHRERWIEKSGDLYVIVSRTTITEEDFRKLKKTQK
jgi:hypothetical protein